MQTVPQLSELLNHSLILLFLPFLSSDFPLQSLPLTWEYHMHAGLDFGTSNNVLSVATDDANVRLLKLERDSELLPSAIFVAERELIPLLVLDYLDEEKRLAYSFKRQGEISRARRIISEEGLTKAELLCFGSDAFNTYMANPSEGYFIKSPKSFLGVMGLGQKQLELFEDICILLLGEIRRRGEADLGCTINSLNVGRPVNFLGRGGEESNKQATKIIRSAANMIGWNSIEFSYEPVAAGHHFARTLDKKCTVLVIDIGGGTSDFSLLDVSPTGKQIALAHQGTRTGGNDFDIALCVKAIMPAFGIDETNKRGLPLPAQLFWQAVSVNDVPAQRNFYSRETRREIEQLLLDMPMACNFERFKSIWQNKRSFELVRLSEQAKVSLSSASDCTIHVPSVPTPLSTTQQDLSQASTRLLDKIHTLQKEVLRNQPTPDIVYTTGGSAKLKIFQEALATWLPNIPVATGHHLDGVASGLALQNHRMTASA